MARGEEGRRLEVTMMLRFTLPVHRLSYTTSLDGEALLKPTMGLKSSAAHFSVLARGEGGRALEVAIMRRLAKPVHRYIHVLGTVKHDAQMGHCYHALVCSYRDG